MRMMRLPQVAANYGKQRSSIYSDIKSGLLTRPVSIGKRLSAWPESEIKAIILARIAGKSDEEIKRLVIKLHDDRKLLGRETD